jgi:hypothetical protein
MGLMAGFRLSSIRVFALLVISISIVLLAKAWSVLHLDIIVEGDIACDEMLLARARHGLLLVGHYSRFGFYHPGPFFFYLRYAAELLAGPLFPGPFEAHLAGILVGNALFIGLAAMAARGLADGGRAGWLAAIGVIAVVFYQFHDSATGLTETWMPNVVRMPYFAFLMQALLLARGSPAALVATSFSAAAAVHGYVAMPLFVGPVWLWAVASGSWVRWKCRQPWPKSAVLSTVLVIAAFLAPMAIDAMVNPPGNISVILDQFSATHAPNDPSEALRYTLQRWAQIHWILWAIPAVALILDCRAGQAGRWLSPLGLTVFSTAIFIAYCWTAPGGILPYIGYFHESLPLVMISFGVVRLAPHLAARQWSRDLAIGLAGAAIATGGGKVGYGGFWDLRPVTQAIMTAAPSRTLMLDTADFDLWPMQAALMVDLERRGWTACAAKGTLFGLPERLCDETRDWPRFRIVRRAACGGDCLAVSALVGAGVVERKRGD